MNNPMAPGAYKNAIFETRYWHSDDFGLRSPVIQKTFQRKCGTSIVERVVGLRRELPRDWRVRRLGPRHA